ncbi:hypothetical protein LCY76_22705 [Fictibacillus sp. KIGAM418]|uniref:Uncharacterized protein n=1 Tax=Fictibacillus marinisediminis TaxID=2878389 RepID=A0A9X1XEW3_9BACL|nr:hypothetical protein [Fictibacillus marinisediminis]MCK6259386.1 hypothetical protein [Fictibacillus marinisediminis]
MLVKDILKMTYEMKIAEIAKDHLPFGEKKLRDFLKSIGAKPQNGKKGWLYDDVEENYLQADINELMGNGSAAPGEPKKEKKEVKKVESVQKKESSLSAMLSSDQNKKRVYKGYYLDEDVHSVIEKAPNKTQFVNAALRQIFKQEGLL